MLDIGCFYIHRNEYITNFYISSIKIHYVFVFTNVNTSYGPGLSHGTFKVGLKRLTDFL